MSSCDDRNGAIQVCGFQDPLGCMGVRNLVRRGKIRSERQSFVSKAKLDLILLVAFFESFGLERRCSFAYIVDRANESDQIGRIHVLDILQDMLFDRFGHPFLPQSHADPARIAHVDIQREPFGAIF